MLVLFTDFGLQGPYIGQVKMRLLQINPSLHIIDLFSDISPGAVQAAAYLLPAYCEGFPDGSIFLCVVDPGVGGPRKPIVVKTQRHWFVGPDNGLFEVLAKRNEFSCWEIVWRPGKLSPSFHGRDLFAPIAAHLSQGSLPNGLEACEMSRQDWPEDLNEVVYIDIFGNAITGFRGKNISDQSKIVVNGLDFYYARTFQDQEKAKPFWYINSNGLIELSINQGNCAQSLGIKLGDKISILNS